MKTLRVAAGGGYDVRLGRDVLDGAGEMLRELIPCQRAAVITDTNVGPLYLKRVADSLTRAGYQACALTLPEGEETKSLKRLQETYAFLCANEITRSDVIVALGGGVIGDLTGLAAATYLRGVPYVQLPTTLLSQVDSAVGGKVAVNLPEGKNLVGAFYQPKLVIADTSTLNTLPDDIWADGMGEVVKYGCIADAKLFELLKNTPGREKLMTVIEDVIYRCLELKKQVVEEDERDTGSRMTLNFGHTLAHSIEKLQHYQGLRHGEAVAAGMYLITCLSEAKGLTAPGTSKQIADCLTAQRLPCQAQLADKKDIIGPVRLDKKNLSGGLTVVLLKELGSCFLYKTTPAFFDEVTKWMK